MSHEATNWAMKQRGLKPAARVVLWHLCDRYNPDLGCFPQQDRLAHDIEISRSSLNTLLDQLEEMALICREPRRDPRSYKQLSTRYRLAFEADFRPKTAPEKALKNTVCSASERPNPAREQADSEAKTRVQNMDTGSQKPCPEKGDSRVQNLDTNPVREPVRSKRESAGARFENRSQPDRPVADGEQQLCDEGTEAADDPSLAAFEAAWPTAAVDSRTKTAAAWAALPLAERRRAITAIPAYLAKLKTEKRGFTPAGSTYLTERRWHLIADDVVARVAAQAAAEPAKVAYVVFKHWSREWWAYLLLLARRGEGQRIRSLLASAGSPNSSGLWQATAADMGLAGAESLKPYRSDNPAIAAWRERFGMYGLKFPDITPSPDFWIFLPGDTPPS